jgi:hypothetical protein
VEKLSIYPRRSDVFDRLVHEGHAEYGDLKIASKPFATTEGNPGVVIAWTARVDGEDAHVQAVTTLSALKAAVDALVAAHAQDSAQAGPAGEG